MLGTTAIPIGTQVFPGAVPGEVTIQRFPKPERLNKIYGSLTSDINAIAESDKDTLKVIDPATGVTRAEIIHAVINEEAVTVADVLARRTMIGLNPDLGVSSAEVVSREMATLLGWTEKQRRDSVNSYLAYITRFTVKAPLA
jgi:glycerol-3-phosphate dehydrogenase